VKAFKAVLPPATRILTVGGIEPANMAGYWQAGAAGFGIGSALFRPGKPLADIAADATAFVAAMRGLMPKHAATDAGGRA
jgi:2-dehydro-3-deoxyphosphogalactonate aldolase